MTISKEELHKKQRELSAKVCSLSSGTLLLNMRYMAKAISRLRQAPYEGSYRCDGRVISYDPAHLLARYKQSERLPVHDYLHMLLHCVFRHWNIGSSIDRIRWNAACDIVTEAVIMKVAADFCDNDKLAEKSSVILDLSVKVRPLTAEKLYAYFTSCELSEERAEEYVRVFGVDDHSCWFHDPSKVPEDEEPPHISPKITDKEKKRDPRSDDDESKASDGDDNGSDNGERKEKASDEEEPQSEPSSDAAEDTSLEDYLENERQKQQEQLNEMWKQLSKEIRSELENFGKNMSDDSQYLVQLLKDLERERCDYAAFLRRFAVSGEVMRADLDTFEPGFYSYGLSLYGNVALIEPPEYKETNLVRDFVIAIDTSGSVHGKLVQSFMKKTYNILKSTESFFTKVNIVIIQCDTEVRDAVQITSQAELDDYTAKMELRGFGGTDFRPVFEYVDRLCKDGTLSRLKGMVYFTDGVGIFPKQRPMYDVAFAFIGEPSDTVPPWAVKLVLEEEDILDER